MDFPPLFPVFLTGLLGSVHCLAMCGGVVTALSAPPRRTNVIPIVATARPLAGAMLAYHAGRLASYAAAGALAGGLAGQVAGLVKLAGLQLGLYWMASLVLVALGLHFMGQWQGLARIEALGGVLWRRLQPLRARLPSAASPLGAVAVGALWGWLPCAMVYSVLLVAMLSGSAWQGAALMLAFGAGTLPMLLTIGIGGAALGRHLRRPGLRVGAGLLILCFGLLGLYRAAHGMPLGWIDALCLTPGALP